MLDFAPFALMSSLPNNPSYIARNDSNRYADTTNCPNAGVEWNLKGSKTALGPPTRHGLMVASALPGVHPPA